MKKKRKEDDGKRISNEEVWQTRTKEKAPRKRLKMIMAETQNAYRSLFIFQLISLIDGLSDWVLVKLLKPPEAAWHLRYCSESNATQSGQARLVQSSSSANGCSSSLFVSLSSGRFVSAYMRAHLRMRSAHHSNRLESLLFVHSFFLSLPLSSAASFSPSLSFLFPSFFFLTFLRSLSVYVTFSFFFTLRISSTFPFSFFLSSLLR